MFVPRQAPFSEQQARDAIARARSWAEATRLLGYRAVGGNTKTLQTHARRWNISTEHFNPRAAILEALERGRHNSGRRIALKDILVENSTYSRSNLKARHCGRNLPHRRECVGCGREFEPTHLRHRYCTLRCFNGTRDWASLSRAVRDRAVQGGCTSTTSQSRSAHSGENSSFGMPRPWTRKVKRPPRDQLLREISATSYVAVARKYGVSDNAIRKWVRFYENEIERRRAAGEHEGAKA